MSRPLAGSSRPWHVERHHRDDARVSSANAGNGGDAILERQGRSFQRREHIAKPLALVVGLLGSPQRIEIGQVHHEHRHAGGDDHGDGQRLSLHLEQVPQELSVER